MKDQKKTRVESGMDSATETLDQVTPSIAGAFQDIPVTRDSKSGTGNFYTVWPKKDLSGTPSRMEAKDGDKVVNKGDIVKDPESGLDIELIRVHRGKRVWYGKQAISAPVAQVAQTESAE
jgi:hypothetical protein